MKLVEVSQSDWLDYDPAMVARIIDDIPENIAAVQELCKKLIRPDGTLLIHRAMVVSSSWLMRLEPESNIGVFWSHDMKTATPYDAKSQGIYYVFSGLVSKDDVDWPETMKVIDRGAENEIRLQHDAPVTLTSIIRVKANRVVEKNVESNLYGKVFRA